MTPHPHLLAAALAAARSALSRLEASGDVDTDEAAALEIVREEAPELDAVLAALLRAMDEAETAMEGVASRMMALTERQRRYRNKVEEYRRTVFAILDALGMRKWKSAEFTVSVQDGRPGVIVTDEAALPEAFVRIARSPDKTKIKAALEAGEDVPGATLANGAPTLTVRTK